jgi:parallel beta-helix repeat protein
VLYLRKFSCALLVIVIAIGILTFADIAHFGTAQASTQVNGIITSDTTWTKASSPYNLTGPVAVNEGVALTIEPGVTVNLGNFYLQVNGTLDAQGTNSDRIIFISSNGNIYPPNNINLPSATAECTIENAILTKTSILSYSGTVKINNCVLEDGAGIQAYSSSIISNNYITGGILVRNSSVVSDNTILNGIDAGDSYTISGSNITNTNGVGLNNGIWVMNIGGGTGTISDNIISGGSTAGINLVGSATIERNLITNNQLGISIRSKDDNSTIQNNTITNNQIGILNPTPMQKIICNNIESNSNYNMQVDTQSSVNATYNWWGTTDTQAINQTIYDNKNDFNLGTVTFVPFLTEPNPEASPTSSPEIPEFSPIILVLLIMATLAVGVGFKTKKHKLTP